ncbi:MAG: helix-turn-helix transcriptional regulator [Methylicorpusculum sp.]|uniref:helix-turn-helix domain-containing protein n=1 Tax=Methylicorpusculum sp. TaxID=2713644 RepID=UPI0027319901|nr:helix-turn-helix transcriptional regulator [Methylicorpusculum sp.]MDP2202293.1 helix-turn-helix transcriptional regulator [Methylicorpusculum sp.]
MSTIGSRLREERERLNLSQSLFGDLGGVKKQAQLKYEKDDRSPDADYLSAIALAGVDISYVLTGIKSGAGASNPREVALLDNYRHSAVEVQLGISKLLAETGKALERASAMTDLEIPKQYGQNGIGLTHGANSHAVNDKDE